MLCDLSIFSGKVYHPEPPHAQSLFLFPIVLGINLILFFRMVRTISDWEGFDHLSWVFDHSSRGSCQLRESEQRLKDRKTHSLKPLGISLERQVFMSFSSGKYRTNNAKTKQH